MLAFICLTMILIQVWLSGVAAESRVYYDAFGVSWDGIAHFKIWQLVSYGLLHAHWLHLGISLLMLWVLGAKVIQLLGRERFGVILVAGVLAGGILH